LAVSSVSCCNVNVAVTLVAAVIDTVHVPVPEQPPPDQPLNVEPTPGVAARTTLVPELYDAEHVAPQLIPAGFDVTVPTPAPALLTVRAYCVALPQTPPG